MSAKKTRKQSLVTKRLREDCQCSGMTVDETEPVLRNVLILGYNSKNGRRYTEEAAREALSVYEGIRVNLNHPIGQPNQSRRVEERFGTLFEVHEADDGIRGNLRYNPHLPYSKAISWWAKNDPSCLGLSHNAVGQGRTEGGVFVVEKIVSVRSVDLVADPATTKGLYEDTMGDDYLNDDDLDPTAGAEEPAEAGHEDHLINAVAAVLKNAEMSGPDKKQKVMEILKVLDSGEKVENEEEDDDEPEPGDDSETEESVQPDKGKGKNVTEEVNELKAKLDKYEAKERLDKSRRKARKLAVDAGLPKALITNTFVEQLANAPSAEAMTDLIEDRRLLIGRKPKSAGPGQTKQLTEEEFKKQLLKGVTL